MPMLILGVAINELFSPNANGVGANGGQPCIDSHADGAAAKRQ